MSATDTTASTIEFRVGLGSCGVANGARPVHEAFEAAVREAGLLCRTVQADLRVVVGSEGQERSVQPGAPPERAREVGVVLVVEAGEAACGFLDVLLGVGVALPQGEELPERAGEVLVFPAERDLARPCLAQGESPAGTEQAGQHAADMRKQARLLRFMFFRSCHQKTKRSGSGALISAGRAVSKSSSR